MHVDQFGTTVVVKPRSRLRLWLRAYFGPLPLFLLAYVALAVAASPLIWQMMFTSYFWQAVRFLPTVFFVTIFVCMIQRPSAPLTRLREVASGGVPRLFAVFVALCIGLTSFTTLKINIPTLVPFYLDPVLADVDNWLHGVAPGEAFLNVLPERVIVTLGMLYGGIWFLQWFGWIAFVTLQGDANLRVRYFWTMALMFALLGTVMATALSSVGPVYYAEFYGIDRFATLTKTLDTSVWGDDLSTVRAYLLDTYTTGKPNMGTGISAMPSMHLAVVTLNALMLWRVNRYAGAAGWVYVGLILIGSVTFGWHYATDGYVSIAVVCLIWLAVGRALRAPPV